MERYFSAEWALKLTALPIPAAQETLTWPLRCDIVALNENELTANDIALLAWFWGGGRETITSC